MKDLTFTISQRAHHLVRQLICNWNFVYVVFLGVNCSWWLTVSTLLFPVSLLIGCWDWVQGGNPLYAAVKCLSGCWGQIWRNFSIFFAKRTWHTHFLTGKFFSETKNNFFPPKLAVFRGSRHFSKIEGPFSEIEGPGFERMWPLLLLSLINNTNNY